MAGILLVVVPAFFTPGAVAIGAGLLGVFLIVTGVKQLRGGSASQLEVQMTPARSRLFRVVGWLLVVPLVAALVFGILVVASVRRPK